MWKLNFIKIEKNNSIIFSHCTYNRYEQIYIRFAIIKVFKMSSSEADNIDKLYKNYDILNDAKEKIAEVSSNGV